MKVIYFYNIKSELYIGYIVFIQILMAALTQYVLSAQILQVGGKAVIEERKACFLATTLRRSKLACYWTESDS